MGNFLSATQKLKPKHHREGSNRSCCTRRAGTALGAGVWGRGWREDENLGRSVPQPLGVQSQAPASGRRGKKPKGRRCRPAAQGAGFFCGSRRPPSALLVRTSEPHGSWDRCGTGRPFWCETLPCRTEPCRPFRPSTGLHSLSESFQQALVQFVLQRKKRAQSDKTTCLRMHSRDQRLDAHLRVHW